MNCNDYKQLIFEYFDRSIKDDSKSLLLDHINICSSCEREMIELEKFDILLKEDSKKFIEKRYNYFENIQELALNKMFSGYLQKKYGFFRILKINYALSSFLLVFFFSVTFYLSFFIQNNISNVTYSDKTDDITETSLFATTDYDYLNITDDKILDSDYFKNDFKILNNTETKLFPRFDPIFDTYHDIPTLDNDELDKVLNTLKNKKFI